MAITLSTVINTVFFCQLRFIKNYLRMIIPFHGLGVAGINSFMGLDQGVNSCVSLYNKTKYLDVNVLVPAQILSMFTYM